jgi:hypothetical protein
MEEIEAHLNNGNKQDEDNGHRPQRMQEDSTGSQGTQHAVALKKNLKIREVKYTLRTQHAWIPRHHNRLYFLYKNRQLNVPASRNQLNLQQCNTKRPFAGPITKLHERPRS